jgi:hypothetical protein
MDKELAVKEAIERAKEQNDKVFARKVENLVWDIERTSQQLRDLKTQLTELTFEEITVPDVSDCMETR